jgi:hypothetical protein
VGDPLDALADDGVDEAAVLEVGAAGGGVVREGEAVAPGEGVLDGGDRHVAAAAAGDRDDPSELAGELRVEVVEPVLEAAAHVAVVLGGDEDEAVGPGRGAAELSHGWERGLGVAAGLHDGELELVEVVLAELGPRRSNGVGGEPRDSVDVALHAGGAADDEDPGARGGGHRGRE